MNLYPLGKLKEIICLIFCAVFFLNVYFSVFITQLGLISNIGTWVGLPVTNIWYKYILR